MFVEQYRSAFLLHMLEGGYCPTGLRQGLTLSPLISTFLPAPVNLHIKALDDREEVCAEQLALRVSCQIS